MFWKKSKTQKNYDCLKQDSCVGAIIMCHLKLIISWWFICIRFFSQFIRKIKEKNMNNEKKDMLYVTNWNNFPQKIQILLIMGNIRV